MIVSFMILGIISAILLLIILAIAIGFNNNCNHKNKANYDSHHKQVCIDCGQEFSIKEIKK